MLAKQKSQNTFSFKEKVSSKPVITTQQIADQLNTEAKYVIEYAKQVLPNKEIVNGIPTTFTEEEVTLILEYAKTHVGNNRSEEMKLAVMFPNATKPSIYINPKTAVPKLMLWKKNNPTKIKE